MDDQQARDVEALVKAGRDFPFIEKHGYRSYSQLVEALTDALAALPVAPEQPTQANLPTAEDNERVARLMAMVTPFGYASTLALLESETRLLEETRRANSLVSSPSVETVTPDRETVIDRLGVVLDAEMTGGSEVYKRTVKEAVADSMLRLFGVSS